MKQNIYDNETFFKLYKELRNRTNANDLIEIPALFSLLPDLKGKHVLDLGCGYGVHCKKMVDLGVTHVVGIDISGKMLEVAREENADAKIEYKHMPMEDLPEIKEDFDVVVSSLAMHYVDNFGTVAKEVYRLLNHGGYFIFSQEHPFNSCFSGGERWTKDENGEKLFANVKDYSLDGPRESAWFVEGVVKYHRTFSSMMNTLTGAGFRIEHVLEPIASDAIMKEFPWYEDNVHKPDFLLIKAYKA